MKIDVLNTFQQLFLANNKWQTNKSKKIIRIKCVWTVNALILTKCIIPIILCLNEKIFKGFSVWHVTGIKWNGIVFWNGFWTKGSTINQVIDF